jgi:hypothetical protein
MLFLSLLVSFLATTAVQGAAPTRIAIVEAGIGGTVQRTTTSTTTTTVAGAVSFFQAMHDTRKIQHAGMSVVPDLFQRADAGIVVGISGSAVDLADLPHLESLLQGSSDNKHNVVGHLDIMDTNRGHDAVMSKLASSVSGTVESLAQVAGMTAPESVPKGLHRVSMNLNDVESATELDKNLSTLVSQIDDMARQAGKTIVLYFVVQEDDAAARRRGITTATTTKTTTTTTPHRRRRLEEVEEGEGEQQQQQEGGNNGQYSDKAGFYGYGYFNDYGEWVTPYKSMFQIQYFNVVLWTSIGLTIVLLSTIYMMMFMPLEPDTLLFGESAKMVGDD